MSEKTLDRLGAVALLFGVLSIAGIGLFLIREAKADEIVMDGRTETAQCYPEYTEPVQTVCVSESFICRITEGMISCEIKR